MKKYRLLLLIFLVSIWHGPVWAQHAFLTDLQLYSNRISTLHANAFTQISKTDFFQLLDSLQVSIPQLTKEQVIVKLMQINARIGDEHTIIFPATDQQFPFTLQSFDEGLAIIGTDSMHTSYQLHRILAINNWPANKVVSQLQTLVKTDNPAYTNNFITLYANNITVLQGLGILTDPQQIRMQLLSPSNDTIQTVVSAVPQTRIEWKYPACYHQLLRYRQNSKYWFYTDEHDQWLYFNYQHCSQKKEETFSTFNERLFATIREKHPQKLIVDLRMNTGGNSAVLQPFLDSITNSYLNQPNRLYVFIGNTVMSSALLNAVALKKQTRATFIGQPTGGNINHFGEVKSFELPYLQLRVTYSTRYHEIWPGKNGALHPDILTSNTLKDFISARDKALQAALEQL